MQNTDFSRRMRAPVGPTRNATQPFREEQAVPLAVDGNRNRLMSLGVVIALVFFTLGVVAGLQLNRFKHIEQTLVKYPDSEPGKEDGELRFANRGLVSSDSESVDGGDASSVAPVEDGAASNGDSADNTTHGSAETGRGAPEIGSYIIKVGTFPDSRAIQISQKIEANAKIMQVRPVGCRNITESVPDRKLTFRTRVKGHTDMQNLLLGCFATEAEGMRVVAELKKSSIDGLASARLYEIQ